MLFALDYHDNRVHIDETQSSKEYFCPFCGAPLVTKKGDVRQHHFAHKSNHLCSDTWERTGSYDISPWHNEWQDCFPKENQEVKLSLGETKHRADVLIGRTVVEFQHSIMPVKAFDNRNNFYFNLNYKVVWLFDLSDIVQSGNITYITDDAGLSFSWKNPKKAFNSYDVKTGCIDLFFQISNNDTDSIVKVLDVSEAGFERFVTTFPMSKSEFLNYVGLVNGVCPGPDRDYLETNDSFLRFKDKYHIALNKQQERTIQSVEGSVLLLAVPGSGKTTVLVNRLGYMVYEKGVDPSRILAISYNKKAAEEMKNRYAGIYGDEFKDQIDFRTINSLSLNIYSQYCRQHSIKPRELIEKKDQKSLYSKTYRHSHSDEYPSESDIIELGAAISYAKNMMLSKAQIGAMDADYPNFSSMFQWYFDQLENKELMDFDDQMCFAYNILSSYPEQAAFWQGKYKYICVDEAQDTSKIQHAIIQIIANGNNIFMVGDEDQSIYGFRAAYPKALLNFRTDYKNPYILRMEQNYRSTPQIVEKAQSFISENKGRYDKTMVANRDNGKPVELIRVNSVEDQYAKLLSVAQNAKGETAFLYRDNESSIVLVDSFLKNDIKFRLKRPELNFFEQAIVQDIIAYLSLIVDSHDSISLRQICNKGILYLKKKQQNYAVSNCSSGSSVFEAVESQMRYLPFEQRDRGEHFRNIYNSLNGKNTEEAIRFILDCGYEKYIKQNNLDFGKIDILLILAKKEPDISNFLKHLKELEQLIRNGFDYHGNIVLSTIHSSKGLEYDSVYMVDVYDGRFPSSRKNYLNRSKDNSDGEQEERRLFYVGITRAKNDLHFFSIDGKPSSYVESLFPEIQRQRLQAVLQAYEKLQKEAEDNRRIKPARIEEERRLKLKEEPRERENELKLLQQRRKEEEDKKRIATESAYQASYNEVKDLFVQQEVRIYDSHMNRWVQCEKCGKIMPSDKFVSYGGRNRENLGECRDCSRRRRK